MQSLILCVMIHVRRAKVHRSVGLTEARKLVRYPANIPGLGEALIFFCCFSSIKGRKAGRETPRNSGLRVRFQEEIRWISGLRACFQEETPQNSRLQAYRIQATSPFCTGQHTFPSERHRKKGPLQSCTADKKPLLSTLYSLLSTLYPLLSTLYSLPSKTLIKRQIELLFESGQGRVDFEEEVVFFL